ncbi:MAG: DUF4394 domain-containing protein [Verrucomicrobia bacterium]|nr:DUF4394 domain-containing protein [Verrucomicrobiota bacterium]
MISRFLVVLAALAATQSVRAEAFIGLLSNGSLISFDSSSPGTTSAFSVSGIAVGQTIQGIDFRPATGTLYAFASTAGTTGVGGTQQGQLYSINTGTGVATAAGPAFTIVSNPSSFFAVDFNPTVDRVRVVGSSGTNLRLNPATGGIAATDPNVSYGSGDPNFGQSPFIVGAAYTNNFAGASSTTLYVYDFGLDTFAIQNPTTGVLTTLGSGSGITALSALIGFDISGGGAAFLSASTIAGQTNLFNVNLANGTVSLLGQIGSGLAVSDIAAVNVVPEPSTYALLAAGGLLLLRRRRAAR